MSKTVSHHQTKTYTEPPNVNENKWNLVSEFLSLRGLVRQHIDSFDHFVDELLPAIVKANGVITSDVSEHFRFTFLDVEVEPPTSFEADQGTRSGHCVPFSPHEARIRDLTYSSRVVANFRLEMHNKEPHEEKMTICRLPIMLRSKKCVLRNQDEAGMARLKECPLDPGGYFVVKGVEKVILIQEQLSRNRIIVEEDSKGEVFSSVTSSTNERKSRTALTFKGERIYLRHNLFSSDIPVVVMFRAMGLESDVEIASSVGIVSDAIHTCLSASFSDPAAESVITQTQALEFIGSKLRNPRRSTSASIADAARVGIQRHAKGDSNIPMPRPGRSDEAADCVASLIFAHVPIEMSPVTGTYDFSSKAAYLGYMVRYTLNARANRTLIDDKDYVGNKRLEMAGQLLALLFEDLFKRATSELKRQCDNMLSPRKKGRTSVFTPERHFNSNTITSGMTQALSTGNWTLKRFKMERSGVTQQLSRLSFISALGHMTRITSQFEKTRKVSGPRALQGSQWGVICPSDTPEGESCGLVKNLALLAHVTTDEDPAQVRAHCFALGTRPIRECTGEDATCSVDAFAVLINGDLLGIHYAPFDLAKCLRELRRRGRIGEFVSIYVDDDRRRVLISTDAGRVCRPLIVVDPVTKRGRVTPTHVRALMDPLHPLTIQGMLNAGLIEYVDVNESNNTLVALTEETLVRSPLGYTGYTHVEIDPATILGVVAGLIPFPHHNQSPRNTYQCAMGKQAIGTIGLNQYQRFDTLLYLMTYPQKPMVTTRTLNAIGFDQLPGGQNAVVAVMSHTGYDIEDAVVLNRGSLDRGYGRCHVVRKFACLVRRDANGASSTNALGMAGARDDSLQERQQQGSVDCIAPHFSPKHNEVGPPMPLRGDGSVVLKGKPKIGSVASMALKMDAVDVDGMAAPGLIVHPAGVLVNKETRSGMVASAASSASASNAAPSTASRWDKTPLLFKGPHPAYVDNVSVSANENDNLLMSIKITTRDTRRPELGDKFSSRHGQKGVVGLIVPHEDMPFSDAGIVPDMIMNPHGFPSRMTVGKLIEFLSGKAAVMNGKRGDATAFADGHLSSDPVGHLCSTLVAAGYAYSGKDFLYSGTSGEPIGAYVFMGPVFYQKLKHMVVDKVHARAKGPRAALTRQPTEGRSHEGGLRLGEMERDCLVAYGASGLLVERLMISSDAHNVVVCTDCGMMALPNRCVRCKSTLSGLANGGGGPLESVRMPYAFKLLVQELQSMNISVRFRLTDA